MCASCIPANSPDDNRMRYVCNNCGTIHYQNPKIGGRRDSGVGARWRSQRLALQRAIEPRHGYWTLPAGFMENDETTEEAARREKHWKKPAPGSSCISCFP